MKLDMDLIREILQEVEATLPASGSVGHFSLAGRDPIASDYHVKKLVEGGFLQAHFMSGPAPRAVVVEMTYAGHQLLDAIRNDRVWSRIKAKMKELGGSLPLELIKPL